MTQALEQVYTRKLSGMERTWLVADAVCPPFIIQYVIEGKGAISLKQLTEATHAVANANPGARMKVVGTLGWTRWTTAALKPSVLEVDGTRWDGMSPEGAPFLTKRLPPRHGPSLEVLLVRGDPLRIILRIHHALTDGQGTMMLARDLFRHLRGEPCKGAQGHGETDADIAKSMGMKSLPEPKAIFAAPTGLCKPAPPGGEWRRVRLTRRPRRLMARTIAALYHASKAFGAGPMRIGVPVDLRRHRPGIRSTTNLSGVVNLETEPLMQAPDPIKAIDAAIRQSLDLKQEGSSVLMTDPLRWWPIGLMTFAAKVLAKRNVEQSLFTSSAAVSSLKRQTLADYSSPDFQASALFVIAPPTLSLPLFMTVTGHENGVDFCGTIPNSLATDGRLDSLMNRLVDDLAAQAQALEGTS